MADGTDESGVVSGEGSGVWGLIGTRTGRWLISFFSPWGRFCQVVFEPFTIVLLASSMALFFWAKALGKEGEAIVQIAIAVLTGIAGARMSTTLSTLAQGGQLKAAGRSAVRGLRLIFLRVSNLESRILRFVEEAKRLDSDGSLGRRNMEEVLESVRSLQLEVTGSIENWTDVVPGSDVSLILNDVGKLRQQLSQTEGQLAEAEEEAALFASLLETEESRGQVNEAEREKVEVERDRALQDVKQLQTHVAHLQGQLAHANSNVVAATTQYALDGLRSGKTLRNFLTEPVSSVEREAYVKAIRRNAQASHKPDAKE